MAEDLNEFFAHNHKMFTKHQYFDSSGLFISLMMSTPLLLLSSIIIVSLLSKHKLNSYTVPTSIVHIKLNIITSHNSKFCWIFREIGFINLQNLWHKWRNCNLKKIFNRRRRNPNEKKYKMKSNAIIHFFKKIICLLWCSKQKKT